MTEPVEPIKPIDPIEPTTFTKEQVDALIAEKLEKELAGIKANRDALLEEKKEQQRIASEAEEKKRLAEIESARKNGDFQKIEEDLRRQLQEKDAKLSEVIGGYEKEKISRKSAEITSGLATESFRPYMQNDIEKRAFIDENGVWRFKDRNGNVTGMTEDEFKADLKSDPKYRDFIILNNSTGGGATGGGFGGGATKNLNTMTFQQKQQWLIEDPQGFEKAVKQQLN